MEKRGKILVNACFLCKRNEETCEHVLLLVSGGLQAVDIGIWAVEHLRADGRFGEGRNLSVEGCKRPVETSGNNSGLCLLHSLDEEE